MGSSLWEQPFTDITLYLPTPFKVGTPEYSEQTSLENFVSDLYVRKMNGYKPPKTSRITIQPAFHNIWNRTWRTGSIVAIAPYFEYAKYVILDKKGKCQYILDLIQNTTLQLSDEYKWDKSVFENAYEAVIENNFEFKINYIPKISRDKKNKAIISIEKTETITFLFASIESNNSILKIKLLEKENSWWYDCVYILAKHSKWYDRNKFGISYGKGKIDIIYSLLENEVQLFENGTLVKEIDFKKYFALG